MITNKPITKMEILFFMPKLLIRTSNTAPINKTTKEVLALTIAENAKNNAKAAFLSENCLATL